MKYLRLFLLTLSLSSLTACSNFPLAEKEDKSEVEFIQKKTTLERQIEILTLEKRKAILERQLEAIQGTNFEVKK